MTTDIFDRVQAFLGRFETSEDIADECEHRKLQGVPCDGDCCIVAELIKDEFGDEIKAVHIDPSMSVFPLKINDEYGSLPDSSREMANEFDDGKWPELVEIGVDGD